MIQSPGIYSQPRLMVPTIPGNTSIRFRVSTCSIAALCAAAALFLSACSTPMEDVRVTLCKDLVRIKRGDEVVWKEVRTETPGYNDALVRLNFSASGDDGSAACYYAYNAVDDTALALSDPLSSYATSPSKMQLDGRSMALIF